MKFQIFLLVALAAVLLWNDKSLLPSLKANFNIPSVAKAIEEFTGLSNKPTVTPTPPMDQPEV